METIVTRGSAYLSYLYRKIESLPSMMQEEVLLFTDFLHSKNKAKSDLAKVADFDVEDNSFSNLSLLSLSKEWDSSEDEEWNTILSEMPSIQ